MEGATPGAALGGCLVAAAWVLNSGSPVAMVAGVGFVEQDAAMGYRVTGVDTPFGGISWEKTPGDRDIARRVVTFLEDRRVLFGDRHMEDEGHCVASALEIRAFLTDQITSAEPGKELEVSLRAMRASARRFVDAGGPHGRDFVQSHSMFQTDRFSLALGDLRTAIGYQLAVILSQYPMPIEEQLASILPAADEDGGDLSWIADFR